jgi:hypothetical protein
MAKLELIISLETTEEYDDAVRDSRRLRINVDAPTPADQLGTQVDRHLRGLRYIKSIETVLVTTLVSRHQAVKKPESGPKSAVAVAKEEGKKAG